MEITDPVDRRWEVVYEQRKITEEEARKLEAIIEQWKVSDTKINFQSLAKALNCPATLLHEKPYENMIKAAQTEQQLILRKKEKNDLRNKARDFIDSKLEYGEPIVAYEVYAHIGRGVNHLKRHFRLKNTNDFIGLVSLDKHIDGDTEVSYEFLPKWWGAGYTTEVMGEVLNFALNVLTLTKVIAGTQTANLRSCRLLEKLGMKLQITVQRHGAEQAIYSIEK